MRPITAQQELWPSPAIEFRQIDGCGQRESFSKCDFRRLYLPQRLIVQAQQLKVVRMVPVILRRDILRPIVGIFQFLRFEKFLDGLLRAS